MKSVNQMMTLLCLLFCATLLTACATERLKLPPPVVVQTKAKKPVSEYQCSWWPVPPTKDEMAKPGGAKMASEWLTDANGAWCDCYSQVQRHATYDGVSLDTIQPKPKRCQQQHPADERAKIPAEAKAAAPPTIPVGSANWR